MEKWTDEKRTALKLKILDIVGNDNLSRNQKARELKQAIDEYCPVPEEAKPKHWPGMFAPGIDEEYCWYDAEDNTHVYSNNNDPDEIERHRAFRLCSETAEESEFVKAHMEARLELIDRIAELNDGWHPDWRDTDEDKTFFTRRAAPDQVEINGTELFRTLEDKFYMKSGKIAELILNEFGEEKIRLALWPKYEGNNA